MIKRSKVVGLIHQPPDVSNMQMFCRRRRLPRILLPLIADCDRLQ